MVFTIEKKRRREALRIALQNRDPDAVAAVLNLPEVSKTPPNNNKRQQQLSYDEPLVDNTNNCQTDWSAVTKALNEASHAARLVGLNN